MIKKEQVLAKLEAFKAYSIAHAEEKEIEHEYEREKENETYESYYADLMTPLYNAVNTYFNTKLVEFNSVLKLVVFNMYCHTVDLTTEYDDGLERDVATNIPQYYNDLREIYYAFPWLSVSNAEFFSAWDYGREESESGSAGGALSPIIPLSNSYVPRWTAELTGEPERELERMKGLLNWLETASDLSLVELLENTGRVTKSLSTQEIGTIIYKDRGVKEIITDKGYKVYIPTYMRG